MHLVGFIIRIFHDARQISVHVAVTYGVHLTPRPFCIFFVKPD